MAINVLVIDDDKKTAERLMHNLKLADKNGVIGEIRVDDSVVYIDTVENYDVSSLGITFDVALIDYQLSCSFTGTLVSAWIALYLQIPRITLTTAAYPGNPNYFNASILKNEITDSPEEVIQRIVECVDGYNAELWLNKQHEALVSQYQTLLKDEDGQSKQDLDSIQVLLDQFEKIIDARQEEQIKKTLLYEQERRGFLERHEAYERKMSELNDQLAHYLEELRNE